MIEAVIFDLDGTLIHLPVDYEGLFKEFKKIMKTDDIHPLTEKISKQNQKNKEKIFKIWDKFELNAFEKTTIIEKGLSLYKEFSEKKKALVTLQGKALVNSVIKHFNFCFNFIITRENSLHRVEQLQIAQKKLKTPFKNILFVGNTMDDLISAEKVKCQFLMVKTE